MIRRGHRLVSGGIFVLLLLAGTHEVAAQAVQAPGLPQRRVPMISQGARITQIVGLSEITLTYHRPGVKGRTIWGGLVPFDKVWRLGANDPTLITFTDPVTIEGTALGAGTYRLLAIPGATEWTIIFNSEVKNWGSVHDPAYDTLKIRVKPEAGQHEEWLSFAFTDLTPTSARVVMAWEKVRVSFVVTVNTLARLESQVGDWRILNQAARYSLAENFAPEQAMAWIDRSLALNRNSTNLRTKAELLAKTGNYKAAVIHAEESIALTKAQNPSANVAALEQLVAEWKKK